MLVSEFATVVAFFEGAFVPSFCFMKADLMHMSIILKLLECNYICVHLSSFK